MKKPWDIITVFIIGCIIACSTVLVIVGEPRAAMPVNIIIDNITSVYPIGNLSAGEYTFYVDLKAVNVSATLLLLSDNVVYYNVSSNSAGEIDVIIQQTYYPIDFRYVLQTIARTNYTTAGISGYLTPLPNLKTFKNFMILAAIMIAGGIALTGLVGVLNYAFNKIFDYYARNYDEQQHLIQTVHNPNMHTRLNG